MYNMSLNGPIQANSATPHMGEIEGIRMSNNLTIWRVMLQYISTRFTNTVICISSRVLRLFLADAPVQLHRFLMGIRPRDWDGHVRSLIMWSWNYFCVDLIAYIGSLSFWKIQPLLSCSFLAVAARFSLKIFWAFIVAMLACTLRFLWSLEEKQSHITDPLPSSSGLFLCNRSSFHAEPNKIQ